MVEDTERCGWVPLDKDLYVAYHDAEWGVPSYNERHLLEMLKGAQAGLSWETILKKRAGYRWASSVERRWTEPVDPGERWRRKHPSPGR